MPNISKYRPLAPSVKQVLSENKRMVEELKKEGLSLGDIAKYLKEQIECEKPFYDPEVKKTKSIPDNSNRGRALEMAIKIVDVLPSTKHEIEENRNINIHITTEAAERAVLAANQEVIDIDAMTVEASEFLE